MVKTPVFGCLPVPLQDENCYSILCRYAVRRGQISSNQICYELFGHTEPLAGYIFKPFRMKDLKRCFDERSITLGPKYGIEHSCYTYYGPFLKPAFASKIRECHTGSVFSSGQAKRINRSCGFSTNHKRNLWYCPECVKQDFISYGETYWRRLPQMPGAVYCPVHRVHFKESGVSLRSINYQLIPATYALIHIPEPPDETGTIFADEYLRLSTDIAWLLNEGFSIPDIEWIDRSFFEKTGRPINTHLLYYLSRSSSRSGHFEDYLTQRIMKETGKSKIDMLISQQLGIILSVEDVFGSMKNFYLT